MNDLIIVGNKKIHKKTLELALIQFLETVNQETGGELSMAEISELFEYCLSLCKNIPLSLEFLRKVKVSYEM